MHPPPGVFTQNRYEVNLHRAVSGVYFKNTFKKSTPYTVTGPGHLFSPGLKQTLISNGIMSLKMH